MKTYTNKSNAARAAKGANGGTLDGLTLHGKEGAWYYGPAKATNSAPAASMGTPTNGKSPSKKAVHHQNVGIGAQLAIENQKPKTPAKKAPAKKAAKKTMKQKVAEQAKRKPQPARKAAAPAEEYDVKNGPTQGRISGYRIDADRDTKHGVKRRSAGTIGGRLWTIFDGLAAKAGGAAKLEIASVKESKLVADFNANKVVIEFYYWRRYHGVRGRGKKQKVAA